MQLIFCFISTSVYLQNKINNLQLKGCTCCGSLGTRITVEASLVGFSLNLEFKYFLSEMEGKK